MRSRIVSIGDELLLGRTVDTNATWLCRRLLEAGVPVVGVQQVGDAEDAIVAALRAASQDADLVVCTGGLGPTDDDRTRHALARVMGRALAARSAAWRQVVRWYTRNRRGVAIPEANRRQALFPVGSRILANDRGTAPGLLARCGSAWIACLPGVPHEMRAMADRLCTSLPRLVPGVQAPTVGEVWFAGIGESQAQERLGGLLTESDPMVGITVSELGHITLRTVGRPRQVRERTRALAAAVAPWRLPEAGLAPSLIATLARRGMTVAAAESCSGGNLAARLTAVPGCSRVLRQSHVTYHASAKIALAGVDPDLIRRHGEVSQEVALALALGVAERVGADVGLATTGIAGPGGGSPAKPVGTVWVAASLRGRAQARLVHIGGDRERVQRRAAAESLLIGWQMLQGGGIIR